MGYQKKQENRPERLFFTKGPEESRIVYLHIGDENTNYVKEMILFRDHLIQNPETVQKYMKLKKKLAEKFAGNRKSYSSTKEKFIRKILRKKKSLFAKELRI